MSGIVAALLKLRFFVTSALMTLREPVSMILAKIVSVILAKIASMILAKQMISLLHLTSPVIQFHLLKEVIQSLHVRMPQRSEEMHLNTLINILSSSSTTDDKKAATIGILSNIPVSDKNVKEKNIANMGQDGAIELLVKMFASENLEAKQSFLNALHNLTTCYQMDILALAIQNKIPVELRKGRETVIGAGLGGLAAVAGRVYTKKMGRGNTVAAADLGGSDLAGTLENPLGLLERQLSYTLHKVRDQCPLYCANGNPVDEYLDKKSGGFL
ncbi:hypothetical protein KY284_006597 [Solanum tuberosum]|nr:hypothetical protein KY284_006597 [Solanum tuberosum]